MAMSNAARARARALRKAREASLSGEMSANSISNRDAQILQEAGRARALRKALQASLSGEMSANSISNRDAQILQEAYMKRNDGGMAMSGRGKPVRTF